MSSYSNNHQLKNTLSSLKTKDREWMCSKEASDYIGTSEGAIRNKVYRGQIPFYKRWNRLYFRKSEIDALIMASKGGLDVSF